MSRSKAHFCGTVIAALFVLSFLSTGMASRAGQGASTTSNFANSAGRRSYTTYVPAQLQPNSGLLVVLHGCAMTGSQMADGTGLNALADKFGFAIIYPEQTYADNVMKCWNWFKPENQMRDAGEASIIVGMTHETVQKLKLDAHKVFITGLSAGSAMAANLLGCYADVFSGGLLQSGLEFAAAQTESDAHSVMANGPSRDIDASVVQALNCSPSPHSMGKVIILHGSADPFVNPINAARTFGFFSQLNSEIFVAAGGDPSQIKKQSLSIDQPNGKYQIRQTETLYSGQALVKELIMNGMGHGWSGGQQTAPFMDPKGIDASQLIVDEFFR